MTEDCIPSSDDSPDCECFDPATNTWTSSAPMPGARSKHASCALAGKLYVMGGRQVPQPFLCYDPVADQWQELAPMLERRTCLSAVAVHGCILAFGGTGPTDEPPRLSSCEKYDPTSNKWEPAVPRLPELLSCFCLCVWSPACELPRIL